MCIPFADNAGASLQAHENKAENLAAEDVAVVLGVRLECAQCHNHPFGRWTRTQFWEYAPAGIGTQQGTEVLDRPRLSPSPAATRRSRPASWNGPRRLAGKAGTASRLTLAERG